MPTVPEKQQRSRQGGKKPTTERTKAGGRNPKKRGGQIPTANIPAAGTGSRRGKGREGTPCCFSAGGPSVFGPGGGLEPACESGQRFSAVDFEGNVSFCGEVMPAKAVGATRGGPGRGPWRGPGKRPRKLGR